MNKNSVSPDCIFCKIINGEIKGDVIFRDELVTAFRDISPVAPTHILIVPNQHVESLNEMTSGQEALIGRMFSIARQLAAQDQVSEGGYRLVVNTGPNGGQTVPHFHLHLIGGQRMHWPPG